MTRPTQLQTALRSSVAQYVTDHDTLAITRLLFDRLPASLQTSPSLPDRP